MKILVLNGPNINFLGIREKGIYGNQDYDTLVKMIEEKAQELGVEVEVFQSNYEGGLIDRIQKAYFEKADGIIGCIYTLQLCGARCAGFGCGYSKD